MGTQTILPSGLASSFAAGDALVGQGILPSGVASSFAAGAAAVEGGPQRISPVGVASSFAAGNPFVDGGMGGVQVWIGGVNRTQYISLAGVANPGPTAATTGTPITVTSQTLGRWTATFDYWDSAFATYPEIAQTFLVIEDGVRVISGGIILVTVDRFDAATQMQCYHVTAQDWSAICDRRVVNATYPAGADVSSVFQDIWQTVLKNPDEGISATGIAALGTDTLDSTEVFDLTTVTEAFDQLCTDQGWVWWIDVYANLHAAPYTNLSAAAFSVTETSDNWRALSASATLVDYRNVQYVKSNLTAVPGLAAQQGGGLSPGDPGYGGPVVTETYTIPQAAAVARGFLLGSIITNFPMGAITLLKVNGTPQPVQLGTSGFNLEQSWWFFPGFPYLYPPSTQNNAPAFPYPAQTSPYPMTGDVVEISYVAIGAAQSAVIAQGNGPLVPATPGVSGTWGSGTFENVQQVQNLNVQSDLNAIAAALLARSDFVPIQIQFETDEPPPQVGQTIDIDLPFSFLSGATTWTITSVVATLQTGVLEYSSQFRTVVQATSGQDLGNSTKWLERLVQRTQNPLPVQQFDEWTAPLAVGGSATPGGTFQYDAADGGWTLFTNITSFDVELIIEYIFPSSGDPIVVDGPTVTVNASLILPSETISNFIAAWNASAAAGLLSVAWDADGTEDDPDTEPFYNYAVDTTLSGGMYTGPTVVAGTQLLPPEPLNTSGTLVSAYAIAAIPPTGQNLVVDVLDNGVSIFGAGNEIIIPAGSAFGTQRPKAFASPGLTVSIGDLLTVVCGYQITGASPTAAANVTVNVRWTTAGLPSGQVQPGVYENYA